MIKGMGLLVLIIGYIAVFKRDIAWSITQMSNQAKGVESKRTETWEIVTTISGILLIVVGIFFLFFSSK